MSDVEVLGILERIIWSGGEQRVIAKVNTASFNQLTIIGDMVNPVEGQEYRFTGELVPNELYGGMQLKVSSYVTILPTTGEGIVRYLAATVKGIGPVLAARIVDECGSDTLAMMRERPLFLADRIQGLSGLAAEDYAEQLRLAIDTEAAMVEVAQMTGGALTPAMAKRAIERWGANAGTVIKRSPYRLQEIRGVGFIRADQVFLKLGGNPQRLRRHGEAIHSVVSEMIEQSGHTRLKPTEVVKLSVERVRQQLHPRGGELLRRVNLITERDENGLITTTRIDECERLIAGYFALAIQPINTHAIEVSREGMANDQRRASLIIEYEACMLLVGAPGTGKTWTVARIVDAMVAAKMIVALAAPTGKAAKQMTMAIGGDHVAKTIHSLLEPEITPSGGWIFNRNEYNLLEIDALILDEASMIDVRLMASLLRALPPSTRLLIVGDHYQLPSVGPGAVLRDLITAGVPVCELTEIKRNHGAIVVACHAIKDGKIPTGAVELDEVDLHSKPDKNWVHIETASGAIGLVIEELLETSVGFLGFNPRTECQLITATNTVGPVSCEVLNLLGHRVLNLAGERVGKMDLYLKDKVVRTRNGEAILVHNAPGEERWDITKDVIRVVNGDIGWLVGYTKKAIIVRFSDPDRLVALPRSGHELKPAWALTVHKMQGSECPVIIVPLDPSMAKMIMVTREWLYTAISRAKVLLITVGCYDALGPIVAKVGNDKRVTGLAGLLEAGKIEAEVI